MENEVFLLVFLLILRYKAVKTQRQVKDCSGSDCLLVQT